MSKSEASDTIVEHLKSQIRNISSRQSKYDPAYKDIWHQIWGPEFGGLVFIYTGTQE